MSTPFRKRRREDLTQYIETDQVQSNFTYDKIGSTIKDACKSLVSSLKDFIFHTLKRNVNSHSWGSFALMMTKSCRTTCEQTVFTRELKHTRKGSHNLCHQAHLKHSNAFERASIHWKWLCRDGKSKMNRLRMTNKLRRPRRKHWFKGLLPWED